MVDLIINAGICATCFVAWSIYGIVEEYAISLINIDVLGA